MTSMNCERAHSQSLFDIGGVATSLSYHLRYLSRRNKSFARPPTYRRLGMAICETAQPFNFKLSHEAKHRARPPQALRIAFLEFPCHELACVPTASSFATFPVDPLRRSSKLPNVSCPNWAIWKVLSWQVIPRCQLCHQNKSPLDGNKGEIFATVYHVSSTFPIAHSHKFLSYFRHVVLKLPPQYRKKSSLCIVDAVIRFQFGEAYAIARAD